MMSLVMYIRLVMFASSLMSMTTAVKPPPYVRDSLAPASTSSGEMEDMELRVAIPPGKIDCYYQEAKKDHTLEISYQVIEITSRFAWLAAGASSDLKIDFTLMNPKGEILVKEEGRDEGNHVYPVHEDGTFTLCFDNTMSRVSSKLVNIDVYLYGSEDDDRWGQYIDSTYTFAPEIQALESLESIKASMNRVRDNLIKVVHSQEERRAIERRDRNIVEQNFEYVNRFSFYSILAFVSVAITQLLLIRSFFDNQSVLRKYLNMLYK